VQRRAHNPNNLSGPSSGQPRHLSGELPPRSRARCRATKSPPRSRAGRPLGRTSASLEGRTPPRENLRLARGRDTPLGPISASLEAAPSSRPPRPLPDQSIKCSGTTRAPGSKVNPCHAGPLTPPGNHISALFRQPSPCGHPWHCRGAVREGQCQICDTVPPTPVRPARRTLRKRTSEPSKRVRTPTPRSHGTTP
jgi:hypothetical protein